MSVLITATVALTMQDALQIGMSMDVAGANDLVDRINNMTEQCDEVGVEVNNDVGEEVNNDVGDFNSAKAARRAG